MFDKTLQRRVMGRFATGVTVVTTRYGDGDQVWGMTANSLTSLSLDPPMVLITIDRRNAMYDYLVQSGCFALNILTKDQEAISRKFAMRGPKDFSDLDYIEVETGSPVIVGALAWLDCRVSQIITGGDHEIVLGEVVAGGLGEHGQPLLFYNGRYTRVTVSGASLQAGAESLEGVNAFEHYGCF